MGVEIHRTGALAGPKLVGVGEGIFEEFHHGDDARGLVFDVFNGGAGLAQVAEQQRHSPAAFGELQGGVYGPPDGFHVVFDAQQEAGHGFATLRFAHVEEGGGGGLEPTSHNFVNQVAGQLGVAVGQPESDHAYPVFEALQVAGAVEGFQCVGGVVLVGAEEGAEPEFMGVGLLKEVFNEVKVVAGEHLRVVVLVFDQVFHFFFQVVEEHGVAVDVLEEELVGGLPVLAELDLPIGVVQVEQGVQRVVVELFFFAGRFSHGLTVGCGHKYTFTDVVGLG